MFCLASWHITLCNVKICKHFLGKLIPNIKLTLLCLTFFWNNRLLSSGMLWQAQTWLFSPTLWGCYKLCQSHFSSDLLAGSQLLLSHGLQANKCPDQKKKKNCVQHWVIVMSFTFLQNLGPSCGWKLSDSSNHNISCVFI